MKIKYWKQGNGFTLIELIVTITIAAILTGIAVPSFLQMIRNNRLSTATNEFISSMHLARSEAIKRMADVSVTATSVDTSNEWGGGWSVAQGATMIKTVDAVQDSNITLDANSGATKFTYSSNGLIDTADSLDICIASRVKGRQITINSTGRVSVNSNYSSCPE